MNSFHLQIVSPDGKFFDSDAKQVSLRTIDGDISILANHIPYVTAIGIGECRVYIEEKEKPRRSVCMGGFLSVTNELVLIAATTFEWVENIDYERAKNSKTDAENIISSDNTDKHGLEVAKIKLARANARIKVVENNNLQK